MKNNPTILWIPFFLFVSLSSVSGQNFSGEAENALRIIFDPPSPTAISVGSELVVQATASVEGGLFSIVDADVGATNGVFSDIGSITGEFAFSDATASGTARINIRYISPLGISITTSYFITVTFSPPPIIVFAPPSPSLVFDIEGELEIQASGFPGGGSFTFSNATSGSTQGRFEILYKEYGIFIFTGFQAAGEASIDVTYTDAEGVSITQTYVVIVEAIEEISLGK